MKRETKVGLTVMAGIVLLYLMVAWAKRIHWFAPDEATYAIQFENVNGLLEGDPVTVRGFISGRVLEINPGSESVEVSISLDQSVALLQNAKAEIQIKELMGGKQIAISPGNSGSPIPVGGTIQGKTSLDFSTSFSQFGQIFKQIDQDNLKELFAVLDTLARNMAKMGAQLNSGSINQILTQLEGTTRELNGLLREVKQRDMVAKIDTSIQLVQSLASEGSRAINEISDLSNRISNQTLPKSDTLFGQVTGTLEELDKTLYETQSLIKKLQTPNSVAGRLFSDPVLASQLDTTLSNLNKALEQIHSEKVIVGLKRKKEK